MVNLGFDFGTSNCAMGYMADKQVQLITLPQHGRYLPSILYAPRSEVICGWLYRQLKHAGMESGYQQARQSVLSNSLHLLNEAKLDGYGDDLAFGRDALDKYLIDPSDCYFVRSPKSFLGSSGVTARQQQVFEDICAATMWHMRQQIQQAGIDNPENVVIGRPVNFQGFNSEQSNAQAVGVLTRAAEFVGFKQIEFLFEPIAAGLAYQATLQQEQRVLVIDIGGGTTDVSMLLMGPRYHQATDHHAQVIGCTGERIGGNDFDIALNYRTLMPTLGAGLSEPNGRRVANSLFLDAAAVNHLSSQTRFYSHDTRLLLQELQRKSGLSQLSRLQTLQKTQMTFGLSATAEQAKIALSEHELTSVSLDYLETDLTVTVAKSQFIDAAQTLLQRIAKMIDSVIEQAGSQPEALFLTGGSVNAPFIQQFLRERYQLPLVFGDNFGSVTSGLTLWSERIFGPQ